MQNDTDRVIAAHRDEARKTRTLLLWIFIGLPLIGLCLWGIFAGATAMSHSDNTSTCDQSSSPSYIDLSQCPLSGPMLTDGSPCSDYNTDNNQVTDSDKTNPAVYFDYQHSIGDGVRFDNDCTASPSATLGSVLQSEGLQP